MKARTDPLHPTRHICRIFMSQTIYRIDWQVICVTYCDHSKLKNDTYLPMRHWTMTGP